MTVMARRHLGRLRAWHLAVAAALGVGVSGAAMAQRFEGNKPLDLPYGPPPSDGAMEGVDARRSGATRAPLPSRDLRVAWHKSMGEATGYPPVVGADGAVFAVGGRGDILEVDASGAERSRVSVGLGLPGPASLLTGGTLVLVNNSGEAVGVRSGRVVFRTRVSDRSPSSRADPLPLEDGGVVVEAAGELSLLDGQGNVRARATLPERAAWSLLGTSSSIVAVTAEGRTYTWEPGREPVRAGDLGGHVMGRPVLVGDHTLLGVVDGTHLEALDLVKGIAVTRAAANGGEWFLGPPAMSRGVLYLLAWTPTSVLLLGVGAAGQEPRRVAVSTFGTSLLADGGVPSPPPARASLLVDPGGTVAFRTPEDAIGVVTPAGEVITMGESFCGPALPGLTARGSPVPPARTLRGFAGMSAAGPGALMLGCADGQLVKIESR